MSYHSMGKFSQKIGGIIMKVLVVGCTHAGTAAILTTRNHFPEAEITVYERNDNISFLLYRIFAKKQNT